MYVHRLIDSQAVSVPEGNPEKEHKRPENPSSLRDLPHGLHDSRFSLFVKEIGSAATIDRAAAGFEAFLSCPVFAA